MTPSGTQLGTDVRGPRALYFGDIYQDASSISHTVVFHTRLRFLGIPPNIFIERLDQTKQSLENVDLINKI